MKKRQYITNVDILLAEGKRIVNTTSDPIFKHRCTLVNMVLSGTPATEIAIVDVTDSHASVSLFDFHCIYNIIFCIQNH